LNNLVETLEWVVVEYDLGGSEIFIFTDNSMAETAIWKGTPEPGEGLRKQVTGGS
jgi:hypothetical protein